MKIPKLNELFDTTHTLAKEMMDECDAPWECIMKIRDFCDYIVTRLPSDYKEIGDGDYTAESAEIFEGATILGPTVIGRGSQIRPGAYIRGSAIIGDGAVIGNSTEVKNAIILDGAQLPHYNYVGDSVIGYKAHLGAGAIASNLRLDKKTVKIKAYGEKIDTGLRKMGVLLGDRAEVGCGAVIYPGAIIGRRAIVYPLARVSGILEADTYFYGDGHEPMRRKGEDSEL